ncbi:MAG: hypothetical protein AAGA30_03595, partial [Planctomycetota bacterium]
MKLVLVLYFWLFFGFSFASSNEPFAEGVLTNGTPSNAVGQSFSPGMEPIPAQVLVDGDSVRLASVLFASGGNGVGHPETRLAIVPGSSFDFNGPSGSTTTQVADVLAVSNNTIDTTSLAYGDPIEFTFSDLQIG